LYNRDFNLDQNNRDYDFFHIDVVNERREPRSESQCTPAKETALPSKPAKLQFSFLKSSKQLNSKENRPKQ
jgi:hypothetical protein